MPCRQTATVRRHTLVSSTWEERAVDEEIEAPGDELEAYDPASDDGEGDGAASGVYCYGGNGSNRCGT